MNDHIQITEKVDGSNASIQKIDGQTYYFDKDGAMESGKIITTNSKMYYIQNNGIVRTTAGFFVENGNLYDVSSDGSLIINKLVKYDGKYYYIRPTGKGELLRNQTAAKVADSLGCSLSDNV